MEERINRLEEGQNRIEEDIKDIKDRLGKVESDVSFLREEVRLGFNTLNTTLQAMFNITASSIRANKEVVSIMENAYGEASAKYAEIKAK